MREMETFFQTHHYLTEHTHAPVRRELMDRIDWDDRLIGILGTRGVGKTTFLLQYAREKFGDSRSCLYINMNNLYFSHHSLCEFAREFHQGGGRVLLIDQIFKHPNYSKELRACHDSLPGLKIVFTGSSVNNLNSPAENPEICHIVKSYKLLGFSFREYLNLQTGMRFRSYSLNEMLRDHEQIAKGIATKVRPLEHLPAYLDHGFYPFFLEKRNFSENLLKTMNMMMEVDILLVKQMELKYLPKIKKLLYLLANAELRSPNVSRLAAEAQTSRATVMNYMQYLQEARLLNMVYRSNERFPKKPARAFLQNTNLLSCIYPIRVEEAEMNETFLVNNLWEEHKVEKADKSFSFLIDNQWAIKLCHANAKTGKRQGVTQVLPHIEVGQGSQVPLWLFGFLH